MYHLKEHRKERVMRILVIVALAAMVASPGCGAGNDSEGGATMGALDDPGEQLVFPEGFRTAGDFAGRFYEEVPVTVRPSMEPVGLPADPGEIINLESMLLSIGAGSTPSGLLENGFVVWNDAEGSWIRTDDPLRAFEVADGWGQPLYVSSGIPLHMLHIFFDQILQKLEEDHFYRDIRLICSHLYEANLRRGCALNAGFYAVPLSFLDRSFVPDPSVVDLVQGELALIADHAGFAESPVMGYREDYSQYVPRGHYTASERLEDYFRAMMWLGRLTFLLNGGEPFGPDAAYIVSEDRAREMTACALLTVSDLAGTETGEGDTLLDRWSRVYELTAFFAGFADDLSVPEYSEAGVTVAGTASDAGTVFQDGFYRRFRDHVNEAYAGPSIYSGTGGLVSMPDDQGEFDPSDLAAAMAKTTGFRFMGQRYTPDSEILGKLVFPAVGPDPSGNQRFMPTGLDVAAAFGSPEALALLEERGDFSYANYADSLESLSAMIAGYGPEDWHATLYMSWLRCLYLLVRERGEGYPDFMRTDAWGTQTLTGFLASWAMLRHDTILYAKQSYTMEAGCAPDGFDEPQPSAGFVEPVPEVYAQLNATLEMARRGLAEYGVLEGEIDGRFRNAISVMTRLQEISERELSGETMTAEDADFLENFAAYLESSICWDGETTEGLETSLIADVHTDQNSSSVLEVASGGLDYCIVVYRRPDGAVEAAVGPVLSYYEFTWPVSDRLTDEAWREMLEGPEPPARPWWAEVHVVRR
ncbi:MAG: hypothetical protein AVO35_07905 [Candidatus Aegiribacteria sp. MLS_C]|nr:MAG: hypothetical protein AVO35_07905 [Candidatus Aegiribacteria sp. MLS_C]